MLRPTDSRIIYLQQLGRTLSSDTSREKTIVFDLVNNYLKNNLDAEINQRKHITGDFKGNTTNIGGSDGKSLTEDIDIFRIQGETKEFLELFNEVQGILGHNDHLTNALNIKTWMEERKTTKPPSSNSKDKEEKRLGRALGNIKQTLVKTYMQLGTQEKEEFEQEHPEFREIMEIINWIDENNISPYLINARDIKQWVEQNQFAKLPSRSSKAVEEERELGKKLSYIRQDLIGTYMKLQTEQEREIFREKHPEIDEVMSIISELDIQCGNAKQKELAILIRQDLEKRKALQEAKKLEKDYKEQLAIRKANVIETQEQGVDINE